MSEKYVNIQSKEEFNQQVLEATLPVLVDFWAPWCGPCRMVGPILEELASAYEGKMLIAKVNTDENGDLSQEHSILSIPTLMIFNEGKMVEKLIGAQPKDELIKLIEKYI